ncbi:hypothetical protein BJX99DRAFT_233530 [Aspergillus californicus]
MPVIPNPNIFTKEGNNESSGAQDQNKKATASDHISKGPQIPDSEFLVWPFVMDAG